MHLFVRKRATAEIADDLAQEWFHRAINLRNLERIALEVGFFLRIAEHLLKRRAGQKSRFHEVLRRSWRVDSALSESRNWDASADDSRWFEASVNESQGSLALEAEALDEALRLLPSHLSAAVRMIACDGLSYEAAANALGVPASFVNNW